MYSSLVRRIFTDAGWVTLSPADVRALDALKQRAQSETPELSLDIIGVKRSNTGIWVEADPCSPEDAIDGAFWY